MRTTVRNSEDAIIARLSLRAAMKQLPPKERDAFLYCDVLGFTQAEAARIVGVGQQWISDLRKQARHKIKKILS